MAATVPGKFGRLEHFATVASESTYAAGFLTAHRLTTTIALLATVASASGLFVAGVYRDNAFVVSAWKGNDLITLVVAIPILVLAAAFARHGSVRALLIWLGLLDYMLYSYAFYLFGAAFNMLFLVYSALVTLSGLALVFALASVDLERIRVQFVPGTPVKWIGGYMLLVASGLGAMYIQQALTFIASGEVPAIVTMTGHPTSVVFALDLSLVVPGLVLGGVWILKHDPWGYVLAGILTVKGALYTLALALGSLLATNAGIPGVAAQAPLWLVLSITSFATAVLLLVNGGSRSRLRLMK